MPSISTRLSLKHSMAKNKTPNNTIMKLNLFKRLLVAVTALCGVLFTACEPEALQVEKGFTLHYPAVSEIAPGTILEVSPTWYGGKPSDFAILSVTLDGVSVETETFTVNPETGAVRISTEEATPVGNYVVGVSCKVDGRTCEFPNAIALELMKAVPDGIVVEPAELSAKLSDLLNTPEDVQLPVAQISSDGSNHVQIKEYLIANVYVDGKINNDCKSWFAVSNEGVFSIVPDNPEFEAGVYTFDFKLTTYIAGKDSQKGIFKNALTLNVTSVPTKVTYSPSLVKVEKGVASKSSAPAYKGSLPGLKYAIKSVTPDNEVGITVDEATGVLNIPVSDKAEIGDVYKVSLTVTNDYGSTDFDEVFAFEVIAFLNPITQFSYEDIEENISGVSISNPVAQMDGAEVTYSFVNLPENLSALEIDPVTGTVSTQKGVELPVGDHTVTVRAENAKGSMEATFAIKVIANPNYFTYVLWGNNLGEDGAALEPLEKYGNQIRIKHGSSKIRFSTYKSDIPEGRPVTFESVRSTGGGSSVTAKGILDIYSASAGAQPGLIINNIKVTVGEGEAAISRIIPIFVDRTGYYQGYEVLYTPFVIKVNPRTGGISDAPVIMKSDGTDVTETSSLDYYTNAQFWNINGPDYHTCADVPLLKNDKDDKTFLVGLWKSYFNALKKTYNRGVNDPMSYWKNYANNTLSYCGAYVDPTQGKRIVINPDKFKDVNGEYAEGAVLMIMSLEPTGGDPQNSSSKIQVNRAILWFDPNYTE